SARARLGDAAIRRHRRGGRLSRDRHDSVRIRERARSGDGRGLASGHRRNDRRRQHDLRRDQGWRVRSCPPRRAGRAPAPGSRRMSRIAVVAYSGGLDTSCILAWLKEEWYGFDEVVAVLVDVGQEFDLEESLTRARAADADDVLLVDRTDAFA